MKEKTIHLLIGIVFGLVIIFCTWACVSGGLSEMKERRERRAEAEAEIITNPLTEKEMEMWTEIYSAAVRRGAERPVETANSAIIELRKLKGGFKW